MELIEKELNELILHPKKEKLILGLLSVVTGKEPIYQLNKMNSKYFEVWFYYAFNFNYTVIGQNNFTVNVSNLQDKIIIDKIYTSFRKDYTNEIEAEIEFHKIKRKLEFAFFSNCWEELENKVGRNVRCFLIEYGILRGIDVNNRLKIEAEEIEGILRKEGIGNHH